MSGESAEHIALVERLIAVVNERHYTKQGIVVFADHRKFGLNQPPTVDGFKPDVMAHDLPITFRVIGEAKTFDLTHERSCRQIVAFLDHLSLYPNGAFYLAVPWTRRGQANGLLNRLRRQDHAKVDVNVISLV
jgi:hypothetical protein